MVGVATNSNEAFSPSPPINREAAKPHLMKQTNNAVLASNAKRKEAGGAMKAAGAGIMQGGNKNYQNNGQI